MIRTAGCFFWEPCHLRNPEQMAFITHIPEIVFVRFWRGFLESRFQKDVLASCVISGAADGSIREPKANSIENLLQFASIKAIFTTGRKAYDLYNRFCLPNTGKKAFLLPSTSPANCACSLADLKKAYRVILPYCQEGEDAPTRNDTAGEKTTGD